MKNVRLNVKTMHRIRPTLNVVPLKPTKLQKVTFPLDIRPMLYFYSTHFASIGMEFTVFICNCVSGIGLVYVSVHLTVLILIL